MNHATQNKTYQISKRLGSLKLLLIVGLLVQACTLSFHSVNYNGNALVAKDTKESKTESKKSANKKREQTKTVSKSNDSPNNPESKTKNIKQERSTRNKPKTAPLKNIGTASSTAIKGKDVKDKKNLHPMNLEEAKKLSGRIPLKITRYAKVVLDKYDSNKNGQIDHEEWLKMPVSPVEADINQDKIITLDEIAFRIANYGRSIRIRLRLVSDTIVAIPPPEGENRDRLADENSPEGNEKAPAPLKYRRDTKFYVPKSRLPSNLPQIFIDKDIDGDRQLSITEFAKNPTKVQISQFQKLDINQDGLVTAKEFVKRTPQKKKVDSNNKEASNSKPGTE